MHVCAAYAGPNHSFRPKRVDRSLSPTRAHPYHLHEQRSTRYRHGRTPDSAPPPQDSHTLPAPPRIPLTAVRVCALQPAHVNLMANIPLPPGVNDPAARAARAAARNKSPGGGPPMATSLGLQTTSFSPQADAMQMLHLPKGNDDVEALSLRMAQAAAQEGDDMVDPELE